MSRAKYYRLGLHRETGSDTHLSSINFTPRLTVSDSDTAEPPSAAPSATNVVPFQPRPSQAAKPQDVAGKNMLTWQPMTSCNGICADTGGLGRFVIRTGDFIVLKHDGEEMKRFGSQDEAMAYAQGAYESLLRVNDDFELMMAMAA
jgi:hypothetical protein